VIKSCQHKGLRELFETGRSRKVRPDLCTRTLRRLDALAAAAAASELDLPGFGFHRLKGRGERYAIWVNGPWRITFEWQDGDAYQVDLEQYH
jgi:proteic killer suppression protein